MGRLMKVLRTFKIYPGKRRALSRQNGPRLLEQLDASHVACAIENAQWADR